MVKNMRDRLSLWDKAFIEYNALKAVVLGDSPAPREYIMLAREATALKAYREQLSGSNEENALNFAEYIRHLKDDHAGRLHEALYLMFNDRDGITFTEEGNAVNTAYAMVNDLERVARYYDTYGARTFEYPGFQCDAEETLAGRVSDLGEFMEKTSSLTCDESLNMKIYDR